MEEDIRVIAKDNKEMSISYKAGVLSAKLKREYDVNKRIPVDVSNIDDKTLERIFEYLDHFKGSVPKDIEKPLQSAELKTVTDEWSANFVDKMILDDLINVTVGAYVMEITQLYNLCCAKLAAMCKDKSEEDIFKVFNITETFTEEEKNELREKNPWITENL